MQAPVISQSSDTTIYIYYGNSTATDGQSVYTWDSNYLAVWHLNETGTNPQINDATANGNNSTSNTSTPTTSGKIAGAAGFDGTDAIAFNPSTVLWDYTVPHTLDLWVNLNTYSGNQWPTLANFTTNDSSNSFALYISNVTDYYGYNYAGINFSNNGSNNFQTTNDVSGQFIGAWNHVVLVYDGVNPTAASSYTLYLNGVSQPFSDQGALWNTTSNFNALGTDTGGGDYVNGNLDEVRISTAARSAGWINFEYHNIADSGNDLTFNTEERAIVWTGAVSASWSDPGNWSPNTRVPGANDIVFFTSNAPGTNNPCSIDDTVSVLGVNIDNSYTGTITDGYYNIYIGSSGWTQAGGTFNGSPGSNHVSFFGPFDLSGGIFNAGTYPFDGNGNGAYLSFNNQSCSFTIDGGTFNQQGAALGSNGSNDIGIDGYGMLNFTMTGGAFNGSSNPYAFIQINGNGSSLSENGNFDLGGGTFTSTVGTLYVCDNFNVDSGATFAANGGTVALGGFFNTPRETWFSGAPTFNNFTFGGESWNTLELEDSAAPIINGALTLAGSSVGRKNVINLGTIIANGNVIQTYNGVDGTTSINIGGAGAQTVTCSNGMLPPVHITNTNATVSFVGGGLAYCETLTIDPGAHVNFAAGCLYQFSGVIWYGTQASPIVLRSSSTGSQWKLLTEGAVVYYVDVKDSDASAGLPVLALNSTDSGNNLNWWFGAVDHVQINTPSSSRTSPAWVEGECGGDVTGVTVSVNQGTPFNANRLNVQQWFANNSSGAIGINLSATSTTNVAVTASDGTNSNTVSQDITWTVTDLSTTTYSTDTVTIRKGDFLLLTANGTGSVLTIDANGDGTVDFTGAPGENFAYQYGTAGTYVAQAWIDGNSGGTLTVIVVDLTELKPVDIQVGYTWTQAVTDSEYRTITPAEEISNIYFVSNDTFLLQVSESVDNGTANLHMTPLMRGNQFMLARLGGLTGPALCIIPVNEFTLDSPALATTLVDAQTNVGVNTLTMRPYIPGIIFNFNMFAHTSTFLGGATSFTINTSDAESSIGEQGFQQVYDAGTGETIGVFNFTLEMPPAENMYCFTLTPFQDGTPQQIGQASGINGNNIKVTVTLTANPQPAITGTSVILTAKADLGGGTFTWGPGITPLPNTDNGTVAKAFVTSNVAANVPVSVDYKLGAALPIHVTGTVMFIDLEITINPNPAYTSVGKGVALTTTILPATSTGGTYAWNAVPAGGTFTPPNPSTGNVTFTPNNAGTYIVIVPYTRTTSSGTQSAAATTSLITYSHDLTHTTQKHAPDGTTPDTRTTIGVCEDVDIITPGSTGSDFTGGGGLTKSDNSKVTFNAPVFESTCIVTIHYADGDETITFKVIKPDGIIFSRNSYNTTKYTEGHAGAGMYLEETVTPLSVCFGNIEIIEIGENAINKTGHFLNQVQHHNPSGYTAIEDDNTTGDFEDDASSGDTPPYTPRARPISWGDGGGYTWSIPNNYNRRSAPGSPGIFFVNTSQVFSLQGNGNFTVTKGEASCTRTPAGVYSP